MDDLTSRILAAIAQLPEEEREDAILELISSLIKVMPTASVIDMRQEIVHEIGTECPLHSTVIATLEMIDGHLAMRQMGLV